MPGRPKPKVLGSVITKTHMRYDILDRTATYQVFYNGKPANVKVGPAYRDTTARYMVMNFYTRGQAQRKASDLNTLFKTTGFTVVELVPKV